MVMRGGGEVLGANFVSESEVVSPAIPPPRIVIRSGLLVVILETCVVCPSLVVKMYLKFEADSQQFRPKSGDFPHHDLQRACLCIRVVNCGGGEAASTSSARSGNRPSDCMLHDRTPGGLHNKP